MTIAWTKHRDGIWPMDIANLPNGGQLCATQYERRTNMLDAFKGRVREWHWSITNASGRKLAEGNRARNRAEARQQAEAALAAL